jgi:glycosyltransferase involved in cell wall biosynthesis
VKRVLIVSPHFPPVNAPDVHRVRMSLSYYRDHGWEPHVLAVRAEDQPEPSDPSLLETLPAHVPVTRVAALSSKLSAYAGIGNVALRAWPQLYREGAKLIRRGGMDLVFFSTTMFFAMPLGRLWHRRYHVPYVLDFQDPWFSTYYDDKPRSERPPKYRIVNGLHRRLERWTMKDAAGVIAVSDAYIAALRARYPWITPGMCDTIPFGASARDFEVAERFRRRPTGGDRPAGPVGVYVGRGGPDMATAARILFRGIADGAGRPRLRPDIQLKFIGTDYAADARARKTLEPVAQEEGLGSCVEEVIARQPYLVALAALRDADFLVLLGSDDPAYSASKVYPYILAKRPLLAILHERSPLVDVLERTRAGVVVTFSGRDDIDAAARRLRSGWDSFVGRFGHAPDTDWEIFRTLTAPYLTERQCRIFDRAVQRS